MSVLTFLFFSWGIDVHFCEIPVVNAIELCGWSDRIVVVMKFIGYMYLEIWRIGQVFVVGMDKVSKT